MKCVHQYQNCASKVLLQGGSKFKSESKFDSDMKMAIDKSKTYWESSFNAWTNGSMYKCLVKIHYQG